MSAMIQIFSWGERWNVPFNEAKPSWMVHFVMWMQQGRICILGKIEFSIDNENAGKNAQVKLYFMPELKVILSLWKK